MNVGKVDNLDFDKVYKVLNSSSLSEVQKTEFVLQNRSEIKKLVKIAINDKNYKALMDNRTLQKFRPLKNSYTKWGDKILLAQALDIPVSTVPKYIKNVVKIMHDVKKIKMVPSSTLEMLKTYVYRHGSKDELVLFFDYELNNAKNKIKCIQQNLTYYSGGVADYFIRPIHRMDNKTLVRLFDVVNKYVSQSQQNGEIAQRKAAEFAKWSLVQIYTIQNNSKLINAVKNYNELK